MTVEIGSIPVDQYQGPIRCGKCPDVVCTMKTFEKGEEFLVDPTTRMRFEIGNGSLGASEEVQQPIVNCPDRSGLNNERKIVSR